MGDRAVHPVGRLSVVAQNPPFAICHLLFVISFEPQARMTAVPLDWTTAVF